MGYTLLQIGEILLKADRTMYRIGSIAYDDMFNELDEALDYNRDIIYIYKKAVEYADEFYVGTEKLDTVVEKLGQKVAVYDFGQLTPVYSDATITVSVVPIGSVLNDLDDVTISNLQDNQILRYNAALGQWINVGPGAAIRSTEAFTATLNQAVFVTTSPFSAPLLDVYLNGVRLNSANYSTFGNYTITFYDGCLADDIIDVIIYDAVTDILDISGYVKNTRTLTINGVAYDLSADRSWNVGTVTSVNMSVPTGFAISGNPITSTGTLALSMASGYSIPTTANQTTWTTAYNDSIVSAAVAGTTTKTLTLNQQDGGTITASWTDINTDAVTSVFGRTGAVVATIGDYSTTLITEGTNLYYLDSRARSALSAGTGISYNNTTGVIISTITQYTDSLARASISLTTTGTSGAATYNSTTGILNIPQYIGGVTSVYGRTGAVVAAEGDYNLTQLGDVTISSPTTGQVLKYNGSGWVNNTDTGTGLTSVGLSMPVAFSVANTPLTANGTLAVTAIGTAAQYIRGDGQLATLPSGSSGGGSVNYYLNGSVNQGTIGGSVYYEMNRNAVIGAGTDFTRTNSQGDGLIAQFITDANDPNRLEIPSGAWNFEMYFNASSAGGTPSFYIEILKYNGSGFVSIASNSSNPEIISSGTLIDLYLSSVAVPQTTLLVTDRIAIRVYVTTNGKDITLHTEDNHLCEIITTFVGGVSALNGLTANTQYFAVGTSGTDFAISSLADTHTFNLPTASSTNRGALSSADWATFNNKLSANQTITLSGAVTGSGSTAITTSLANSIVGITNLSATGTPSVTTYLRGDNTWGTISTVNIYTASGSLTSARAITLNAFNLDFIGSTHTNRITAAGRLLLGTTTESTFLLDNNGTTRLNGNTTISGSTTATSGVARNLVSSTLVAAANNDVLAAIDIAPTFTNGAFSNVRNYGIRSTADIAFTNDANRTLTIQQSTNIIEGRSLTINGGSANDTGIGTFNPLSQANRSWFGMASTTSGDVFAVVNNGDIYKRTGGVGNFVGLGQTTRQYKAISIASNGDIYVTSGGNSSNNGIYKSINGGSTFTTVFTSSSTEIYGICVAPNGDIYYSISFGNIYKSTDGGVTFSVQGGGSGQAWKQMAAAPNGDIYAAVNNDTGQGQIWKQTGGTGNFVSLGQTVRNYWGMTAASNGDIYATVVNGDIYKQTGGVGNFIGLGVTSRGWYGITALISGDIYASVGGNGTPGDIYLQTSIAGTPNLNGGTLILASGAGKGTGTSTISLQTGTTLSSGTLLQTLSTKMTILGNGSIGMGTITPNASSLLDITSITKGFLPPRMTSAQRDAISTPATGLQIYNTTTNANNYYNGTAWVAIGTGSGSSGFYTPTISSISNISSFNIFNLRWIKIDNVVYVSGSIGLQMTSTTTTTGFSISLPITSAFTLQYDDLGGSIVSNSAGNGVFVANAGTSLGSCTFNSTTFISPIIIFAINFSYIIK